MMAKTRLSVAILAATLSLVGCIGDDTDVNNVPDAIVGFEPVPLAGTPIVPFPFDAFFVGAKAPTLNIPNSTNVPFVAQANMQDGFSTTASWFMDVFGFLDMNTVGSHVVIFDNAGKRLEYGVDFTVQSSTVKDASGLAIDKQRTRILIEPLKPLKPSATYLVGLTKGIKTVDGGGVAASAEFMILSSATEVNKQTAAYLAQFDTTKKAQLEGLRSQLIYPAVQQLTKLGVTDLVLAYTVTTQSTTKTLDMMAAEIAKDTAMKEIFAVPIGQTVAQVLTAAGQTATPPNADQTNVYVGTLKVPYYGDVTSAEKPTAVLGSFWKADAAKPDASASFLGKAGACGAYAAKLTVNGTVLEPSMSTTTCFPMPIKQSDQTIPMIVTVPKGVKPEGGWPVVIFQHGITRNRTDIFAVASSFAAAKHITVSIDLPLHGLPAANPFYKNQLLSSTPAAALMTANERTFDADFVNNTTNAAGPDANADGSGTHFINLASPMTSRDNLRQGAADILVLAKSLAHLNIDGITGGDINMSQVRFSGISLGSIVGSIALGADKSASLIGAASLSVGGGAIPKLLDASKSYGPIIAGGLAGNKVLEDTDSYETFMRFAQTLTDSGDPINFAASAKMSRPIHFTQVLNDLVVPNAAEKGAASATQDFVGATGFLSGNTALARIMGFAATDKKELDVTTFVKSNPQGSTWIQFNQGSHGSLLDPTSNASVTAEMQCQTASFFATNGAIVPIGCSKP